HVQEDARIIELRQRAVGVERSLLADRVPILGQALEAIEAMKLGGGIWRGVRPSSERSAAVDAEFQINDLVGSETVREVEVKIGARGNTRRAGVTAGFQPSADLEVVDRGVQKTNMARFEPGTHPGKKLLRSQTKPFKGSPPPAFVRSSVPEVT